MPPTTMSAHCRCHPLSSAQTRSPLAHTPLLESAPILTSTKLQRQIRARLKLFLDHNLPLSILVLHISQLETPGLLSQTASLPQRQRFHTSTSQVEQVIRQMRRTLRVSDTDIIEDEAGAALILPGVDHLGAQSVLERVYQSISLLQAKTIIPPLQHETEISIGLGTYPEPGISLERLLHFTSATARQIILRPAIYPQDWFQVETRVDSDTPRSLPEKTLPQSPLEAHTIIPFMHLPDRLPPHLTHLLPCKLARRLKCAPVGYEKDNLTVAMASPTSTRVIQILGKKTNMHIFPVACNRAELQALLSLGW